METILLIVFATIATIVLVIAEIEHRRWEKSDEPWRYNSEMTMVENGEAHNRRKCVLAARRLERAKKSQLKLKNE